MTEPEHMHIETWLRRRVLFVAAAAITINLLGVTAAGAERGAGGATSRGAGASVGAAAPAGPTAEPAPPTAPTEPPPPPAPASTVEVSAAPADTPAPPSTLALEAPAPSETPAPEPVATPAPEPAPTAEAHPSDPLARAEQAMQESAPARWLSAIPHRISIIEGTTSYGSTDGTIYVSRFHASGDWDHLRSVLGHEFGHLIAYAYGSQAYLGAPPAGWPDPGYGRPEEAWADCVEYAFTAIADPAYGMPVCSGSTLSWTQNWLATNP